MCGPAPGAGQTGAAPAALEPLPAVGHRVELGAGERCGTAVLSRPVFVCEGGARNTGLRAGLGPRLTDALAAAAGRPGSASAE